MSKYITQMNRVWKIKDFFFSIFLIERTPCQISVRNDLNFSKRGLFEYIKTPKPKPKNNITNKNCNSLDELKFKVFIIKSNCNDNAIQIKMNNIIRSTTLSAITVPNPFWNGILS